MKSHSKIILFLLLLETNNVFSQSGNIRTPIRILPGEKSIENFTAVAPTSHIDTLWIRVVLPIGFSSSATTLRFTLLPNNLPNNPILKKDSFVIPAKARINPDTISDFLTLQTDNTSDTLFHDLIAGIALSARSTDSVTGLYTVRLVSGHSYSPNKPFWIEVGANFDLASQQLQTTNVFGGVFFYKRDLRPVLNRKKYRPSNNLAVAAGVYESKNFSQSNNIRSGLVPYFDVTSYPLLAHPDSFARYVDTGVIKLNTQIRNIGLFFSPQVRLSNHSANADGIHFFVSAYAEVLWQNIENTYDYSGLKRYDTTFLSLKDIGGYNTKPEARSVNIYSHYEGLGLPVFVKYGDANLYVNPVIGGSNQPTDSYIRYAAANGGNDALYRQWKFFYLVQFRLSEEKYGISFSGEVRQLIGAQSVPYITLILSKKFDLTKLIEFK